MCLKSSLCFTFFQAISISFDEFYSLFLLKYQKIRILLINMATINERIIQLRKARNWSQDELAKAIGSSRIMIGKYERGENTPSLEVIMKLAKAFEVTTDYLLGETMQVAYDREIVRRLEDMATLPDEDKQRIFYFIDLIIRDFKTKNVWSK